jgi:hypothetical protein
MQRAKQASLTPEFQKKLNSYTLAAAAAGVGVLALVSPAEAKVIFTPVNVSLTGPHSHYQLDLNHDGVIDFSIGNSTLLNTDQFFWDVFAEGPSGNEIIGTFVYHGFPRDARAITAGQKIGPGLPFYNGVAKLASLYQGGGGTSAHGNWVNVSNRFLGLAFKINGQIHFGWARLTVQLTPKFTFAARLTGYAYETTPNKAILAGQTQGGDEVSEMRPLEPRSEEPFAAPATLGLLAQGSPGLVAWRKKEFLS